MWNYVIPFFLDRNYNLILHSQRGHGLSGLPPPNSDASNSDPRPTTIPLLAQDIHNLLTHPELRTLIDGAPDAKDLTPIHSVIGVSQGGAAALSFATLPSERVTRSVIACDTSARTAPGNKEAWAERIQLARGPVASQNSLVYATAIGLPALAKVTVPRWFPTGSPLSTARSAFVDEMIRTTPLDGFVAGAEALSDFDLIESPRPLFSAKIENVLLLAGELDGGGKVGAGLKRLQEAWTTEGREGKKVVKYVEIAGAGHLPMVDKPEQWCEAVGNWLAGF